MGLLRAARDLRRRVRALDEVTVHHYEGLLEPGVAVTRDTLAEQVRIQAASGRVRLVSKIRLVIRGLWSRFEFRLP